MLEVFFAFHHERLLLIIDIVVCVHGVSLQHIGDEGRFSLSLLRGIEKKKEERTSMTSRGHES